jgi:hypothetical protein
MILDAELTKLDREGAQFTLSTPQKEVFMYIRMLYNRKRDLYVMNVDGETMRKMAEKYFDVRMD